MAGPPEPTQSWTPELSDSFAAHALYNVDHSQVLALTGDWDLINADELESILTTALLGRGDLLVDLTDVTFIDAHFVGRLLSATATKRILVIGASGIVARVLDILDPDERLPRRSTVPDLLA